MVPSSTIGRKIPPEECMPRLDLYVNYELQASIKLDGDDVVLGRAAGCAVQIPDPKVSRRHAVIYTDNECHAIENFGANGTRVNGRVIDARQALQPGDAIFISSYILVYQSDAVPAEQSEATIINMG
jgi:pSer/pThr/pTyr-binding forkhead associated (FHA) protein